MISIIDVFRALARLQQSALKLGNIDLTALACISPQERLGLPVVPTARRRDLSIERRRPAVVFESADLLDERELWYRMISLIIRSNCDMQARTHNNNVVHWVAILARRFQCKIITNLLNRLRILCLDS